MDIPTFANLVSYANPSQVDCLWAILKYKEIGILRKIKCMGEVLGFDELTIHEFPKDENGRLLDHECRHLIHDLLLQRSKELN
jgi:hypothetical protein